MRIQELERKTGLDRATIRFYEKESLICPERSENGYRMYSEADAVHLGKIKLLRQLGMSIDQIRNIQQGSGDLGTILENQIRVLNAQIESKRQAAAVCRELQKDGVTYENLDAERYLALLRTGSQAASVSPAQPRSLPFRESVPREVHPLRRYVARMVDINILSTFVYLVLFIVLRLRPLPTGVVSSLLSLALWLMWMPIEALLLSKWGTTPGKWIMGIRLESVNGGKLTFSQALDRVWRVFGRGIGYGIPIWSIWRLFKSYQAHMDTVDMEWDDESEITYSGWGLKGKALLASAGAVILTTSIWVTLDSNLPKYRTDNMTVAQFAENYNFYHKLKYGNANLDDRLQPDGKKYVVQDNSVVIHIDGEPAQENQNFVFETQDGIISRITYENSWTDVFAFTPLAGDREIAALAAALGQAGISYQEMQEFLQMWESAAMEPQGELSFGSVLIRWEVTAENLEAYEGHYFEISEDLPSRLNLKFEIVWQ